MTENENRVNLLVSALLAHKAPKSCPEVTSGYLQPHKTRERITLEDYNGGRTLNVECAGANSKVCNVCIFKGRGRTIGGNV